MAEKTIAVYAFPQKTVYDPDNLDALMKDVYSVSPEATGFPTTHQGIFQGCGGKFHLRTQLALVLCLLWVMAANTQRSRLRVSGAALLIGGGWMLGLDVPGRHSYNFATSSHCTGGLGVAVDYGCGLGYRGVN